MTEAKTSGICVGTMNNITVPATEGSNSRRPKPLTIRHCYIGCNMGAGGDVLRDLSGAPVTAAALGFVGPPADRTALS